MANYNIDIFKEKFISRYGEIFDFSKSEYKGSKIRMKCICPKHGEFEAAPNFLMTQGKYACRECYHEENPPKSRRKPFSKFVEEARAIHGDKYEYFEDTYKTTHDNMLMKCNVCGHIFPQTPNKHVGKEHNGCPKCARRLVGLKCRKPYEKFLEQANEIHGGKYIYHNDYVNAWTQMRITCPIHGDFPQRPYDHISGRKGCPKCSESHLERDVRLMLERNNIKYVYEKRFPWLGLKSLDFYLPDYNIAIECQGKQHFGEGGWIRGTEEIMERDVRKNEQVNEKGIKLLYYCNSTDLDLIKEANISFYTEENTFYSTEELLNEILK